MRASTLAFVMLVASVSDVGAEAIQPQEPLLRAGVLMDRAIRAQGGASRLREVQALHAVGEIEAFGGFPGAFEFWHAQPLKHKLLWDIRYVHEERGFDGAAGWRRSAAVRELHGAELAGARRAAVLFPLLEHRRAGHPATVRREPGGEWLLEFALPGGEREQFGIDPRTFLVTLERRWEMHGEGPQEITTRYDDYRRLGNVRLPYLIELSGPELTARFRVSEYLLNPVLAREFFSNPEARHASAPYELRIATIPTRLFKEPDGLAEAASVRLSGIVYHATESWTADFIISERYGRYVEPERAVLEVYCAERLLERHEFTRPYLERLRKSSVARFAPQPEIYNFRHTLSTATLLDADRLVYTFDAMAPSGEVLSARHETPLERYRPKTKLAFPLKGRFLITTGHEHYELAHKFEWSQGFALDIVALGESFELARDGAARSEDYVGFANAVVLAPADGMVIYARNDVPDKEIRTDFLTRPDGLAAIGGNLIIIDHGQSEYSVLAHLQQGSVRVTPGERVVQGQALGRMGSSGSPGLPHLHYQLQSAPTLFNSDGLPLRFENVQAVAWSDPGPREVLKRGVYYVAR